MQGFNMGRYVPPDQEGVISGNKLHHKHALGARASKLASHGVLTVRFEMPFAVWCDGCAAHNRAMISAPAPTVAQALASASEQEPAPTNGNSTAAADKVSTSQARNVVIIGQGVRFNAEKKKVGMYHSSPIFSFRMRHPPCGGTIEIRTDPQNTAYVVVSGARRRNIDSTESSSNIDSLVPTGDALLTTPRQHATLRTDAFSNLEKTIADREVFDVSRERISELAGVAARQWDDPYRQNQMLRRAFRVGRRRREAEGKRTEELKDRMSLGIELLAESEEDAKRARLVDFGPGLDDDRRPDRALQGALFTHNSGERVIMPGVKVSKSARALVSEVSGNTRAASDPFLAPKPLPPRVGIGGMPGFKPRSTKEEVGEKPAVVVNGLVDYESD